MEPISKTSRKFCGTFLFTPATKRYFRSMKNIFSLLLLFYSFSVSSQNAVTVLRNQKAIHATTINLSDPTITDWNPLLVTVAEAPKPANDYSNKKEILKTQRLQKQWTSPAQDESNRGNTPAPIMLNNFTANNSQSTPNDNHLAISNGGKIVSVTNSIFKVYDEAGLQLQSKSLSLFGSALGLLQGISDPRAIYDPQHDRFVVMFFAGNTSATSTIVLGFSQTNDPAGVWNLYALSGNYLNDTTWSDYPIVALSQSDLFFTFNHLKDGQDWKTGFRYSAIWQVDKLKGYTGDTLEFNFWHSIGHNGKPIWSVCPVQGGSAPSGPETYFLSVRPGDLSNDTVFLHTISDSYQSGNAQFSTKILKTDKVYGLPPNALQKDGQYLATNDARVLSGFIENNKIQYVQNCVDTQTVTATVYVGEIDNPSSVTPQVRGKLVPNSGIEFAYPSIAYLGNGQFDNRAIITCSYVTQDTFPGTAAFYKDASGNISDILIVKPGEKAVNVLTDSVERWGDYTGIQKKYNEPNTAWLAGSYVYPSQQYRTWIAKVVNADSAVVSGLSQLDEKIQSKIFPNPASEQFSVEIELPRGNYTNFALYDATGKLVRTLLEDNCKPGKSIFSFNTQHLHTGVYFLKISNREDVLKTEKVIVSR